MALLLVGCAEPAWNAERLVARYPALPELPAQRLAETQPYVLPVQGELLHFLCRWPDGQGIPVFFPAELEPAELRALEAALLAWEGAGLGVRFERRRGALSGDGIEVALIEEMLSWSANTVSDCAVEPGSIAGAGPDRPLDARIRRASIHLARGDPRLAGSALHEIGHALGFQGHPRRGATVMVQRSEVWRGLGERVLRGEGFVDEALAALYALPRGAVLARRPLPRDRSAPVDALLARGAREDWLGPLVRVGDRSGRVAWWDAAGERHRVRFEGLAAARRDPASLRVEGQPDAQPPP